MDPLVTLLLKNGAFGILAGIGFYLYFKERKISQKYTEKYLEQQIASTASQFEVTKALEAIATTIGPIRQYIDEQRLVAAREEGRREAIRQLPTTTEDQNDL